MCDEIDSELLSKNSIINYANKFIDILAHLSNSDTETINFSKSFGIRYFNELMLFNRKIDHGKMLGKILFNKKKSATSYKDLFLTSIINDTIDYEYSDFLGIGFLDVMKMEFGDYNVLKDIVIEKRRKLKELSEKDTKDPTGKQINALEKQIKKVRR